jgi:hypothetical protein
MQHELDPDEPEQHPEATVEVDDPVQQSAEQEVDPRASRRLRPTASPDVTATMTPTNPRDVQVAVCGITLTGSAPSMNGTACMCGVWIASSTPNANATATQAVDHHADSRTPGSLARRR